MTVASGGQGFFALSPERVLDAARAAGLAPTGAVMALPSLENRVYELALEEPREALPSEGRRPLFDGTRVVAKLYRPGRWGHAGILEEHALLAHLAEHELPVCAPLGCFADGATLCDVAVLGEPVPLALFPRVPGRTPDELVTADLGELGRLVARLHGAMAHAPIWGPSAPRSARPREPPRRGRPTLDAAAGATALAALLADPRLPSTLAPRLEAVGRGLLSGAAGRLAPLEVRPIHADLHRGNLIRGRGGFVVLDFDDVGQGPAAQDLWLLLPGRVATCPADVDAFVSGYETLRRFDPRGLDAIEALRGLRYLRYAAWIAARWDDPAFPRAFPDFGRPTWWEGLAQDLAEQAALVA